MKKFFPYIETPGDLKLYVLAQNGRGNPKYKLLATIDKWTAEWDTYRDRTRFSISTTGNTFGDHETPDETFFEVVQRASHVAKGNGEIYSIVEGDSVQAYFFDFAYKILGRIEANKTFVLADTETIPPEEPEEP